MTKPCSAGPRLRPHKAPQPATTHPLRTDSTERMQCFGDLVQGRAIHCAVFYPIPSATAETAPKSLRNYLREHALRLGDRAVAEEAEDVGGFVGGDENFFAVDSFTADGNRVGLEFCGIEGAHIICEAEDFAGA
jgi:hypothetical protein